MSEYAGICSYMYGIVRMCIDLQIRDSKKCQLHVSIHVCYICFVRRIAIHIHIGGHAHTGLHHTYSHVSRLLPENHTLTSDTCTVLHIIKHHVSPSRAHAPRAARQGRRSSGAGKYSRRQELRAQAHRGVCWPLRPLIEQWRECDVSGVQTGRNKLGMCVCI